MDIALPGGDIIDTGLQDLSDGRETVAALLVAIGAPRLRQLGFQVPDLVPSNPEHRLYDLLVEDDVDAAHSRYNSLIRKLVSFERAAACVKK